MLSKKTTSKINITTIRAIVLFITIFSSALASDTKVTINVTSINCNKVLLEKHPRYFEAIRRIATQGDFYMTEGNNVGELFTVAGTDLAIIQKWHEIRLAVLEGSISHPLLKRTIRTLEERGSLPHLLLAAPVPNKPFTHKLPKFSGGSLSLRSDSLSRIWSGVDEKVLKVLIEIREKFAETTEDIISRQAFDLLIKTHLSTPDPFPGELIFLPFPRLPISNTCLLNPITVLLHEASHFADVELTEDWVRAGLKLNAAGLPTDQFFEKYVVTSFDGTTVWVNLSFWLIMTEARAYEVTRIAGDLSIPDASPEWTQNEAARLLLNSFTEIETPGLEILSDFGLPTNKEAILTQMDTDRKNLVQKVYDLAVGPNSIGAVMENTIERARALNQSTDTK